MCIVSKHLSRSTLTLKGEVAIDSKETVDSNLNKESRYMSSNKTYQNHIPNKMLKNMHHHFLPFLPQNAQFYLNHKKNQSQIWWLVAISPAFRGWR